VMYEIPSRADVRRVIINADVITARNKPLLITRSERTTAYPEDESA
jgi:ATP-dependent Clp protease ATP-binding subunit ClpX